MPTPHSPMHTSDGRAKWKQEIQNTPHHLNLIRTKHSTVGKADYTRFPSASRTFSRVENTSASNLQNSRKMESRKYLSIHNKVKL